MVLETLTSAGEVILIFQVMPYYGTMMAFALMFSIGFIPSLCKLLFSTYSKHTNKAVKIVKVLLDLLAFLVQAVGIGYPIVLKEYLNCDENIHKGTPTYRSVQTNKRVGEWAHQLNGTNNSLKWQVCHLWFISLSM